MRSKTNMDELLLHLHAGTDDMSLNEKIFALVEGWDWPLYGAAQDAFEADPSGYDYLGNADIATRAATSLFAAYVWDEPDWEPMIQLKREGRKWKAAIGVDARHAEAVSQGGAIFSAELGGSDERAGAAIMKAAIGLRALLVAAREKAPDDTMEP